MKRREPFFKKPHNASYMKLSRRPIRPGTNEKASWEKYHELTTAR